MNAQDRIKFLEFLSDDAKRVLNDLIKFRTINDSDIDKFVEEVVDVASNYQAMIENEAGENL